MKIIHLIDNLYPGGAERVLVDMCNGLLQSGIYVEVVVISGAGLDLLQQLNQAIPTHVIGRRHRFDWLAAKEIAQIVRDADLLHVHMRHNHRYLSLLCRVFGINTPVIFQDHYGSVSVPVGFSTIFKPTYYVGVSSELTSWALEKLRLPAGSVFLLENTVSTYPRMDADPVRDLVLVSNLKPLKNQLFALDVARQGGWSLDLIGGEQDKGYVGQIRSVLEKNLLAKQVSLISDCLAPQVLLQDYRLGLHTSSSETGPLVIIEYLAQGLPFLAYHTGSAADRISNEFPEFFIRNFESAAWVERIGLLLSEKPDIEKMNWVFEKYFSRDTYFQTCMQIYDQVQASSTKSRRGRDYVEN